MNSAELVAKIKNIVPKLEERSAKGFANPEATKLLYELSGITTALLAMAMAEAREGK